MLSAEHLPALGTRWLKVRKIDFAVLDLDLSIRLFKLFGVPSYPEFTSSTRLVLT